MDKENNRSVLRKRGRPAGKHRVPLSQNERRARNAQYERERRVETNEALADLAVAVGCKSTMCHSDLLATVITRLEQASRIKHSSDLASLRRCNKNLMAQIACLEQRLAGANDEAIPKQQQQVQLSGPVKRRRSDCESLVPDSLHLPKFKYSPVSSPEPKYSPEPSPPPACYNQQGFYTEPKFSPASDAQPFEAQCSPDQQFSSAASLMSTRFLPVPKVSPLSDSSGHQPDEAVDYSAYRFAGAQLPTPEYQIMSEPPYTAPETYDGQMLYGSQLSPLQYPSSPEEELPKHAASDGCPGQVLSGNHQFPQHFPSSPFSPSHYMVTEACHSSGLHHGFSGDRVLPPQIQYSLPVSPYTVPISYPGAGAVRPDEAPSMAMHGSSMLPAMGSSGVDPRQVGFLSTEDLISVYLSQC